jgi:Holliday junction DNA helicase RuvA
VIAFVRGVVAARDGAGVVIAVGGVGLRINTPASTLGRIGGLGEEVMLHTYLYVREEQLTLYGFASEEERSAFELLLTVSGVGPKGALGVLSALSVDQLRGAIGGGNVDLLTVVPGIGKRIASRIVLDLREKIGPRGARGAPDFLAPTGGDAEVIEALTQGLGYTPQQAAQAVAALGPEAPRELEERIRAALRFFSGTG